MRSLVVHPSYAGRGLEHELGALIACEARPRTVLPGPGGALRAGSPVVQVRISPRVVYLTMLLVTLPHVLLDPSTHPAVVMFVWSAAALVRLARVPRIPRAIVHRPRPRRLRGWGDAMLLRLGEMSLAYGHHMLGPMPPPRP